MCDVTRSLPLYLYHHQVPFCKALNSTCGVCSVASRSDCGCAVQLPAPLRGLFVVATDCVGGFVEHDFQLRCLFIPLISSGAAGKGRGSLCLPSDGWMTEVDRCGKQEGTSAFISPVSPASGVELNTLIHIRICSGLQYCISITFIWY